MTCFKMGRNCCLAIGDIRENNFDRLTKTSPERKGAAPHNRIYSGSFYPPSFLCQTFLCQSSVSFSFAYLAYLAVKNPFSVLSVSSC
jgi:hypothetical protein